MSCLLMSSLTTSTLIAPLVPVESSTTYLFSLLSINTHRIFCGFIRFDQNEVVVGVGEGRESSIANENKFPNQIVEIT